MSNPNIPTSQNPFLNKIRQLLLNREVVSYLIFGVLTTLVDYAVYGLCRFLEVDYRAATVVSWIASVIFAYITNKLYVFESKSFHPALLAREFASFVACRLVSGAFNLASMIVLVDYCRVHELIAKVATSVIVVLLNYIFSKLFIFKKKQ